METRIPWSFVRIEIWDRASGSSGAMVRILIEVERFWGPYIEDREVVEGRCMFAASWAPFLDGAMNGPSTGRSWN